jgi:hypothetical protein
VKATYSRHKEISVFSLYLWRKGPPSLLDLPDHLGGISRHDCFRGHIPGHNCPCAHHSVFPDSHSWQKNGTAPDPHIIFDLYRFGHFPSPVSSLCLNVMGSGIDPDGGLDHDMVANAHLITIQNGAQNIPFFISLKVNLPWDLLHKY